MLNGVERFRTIRVVRAVSAILLLTAVMAACTIKSPTIQHSQVPAPSSSASHAAPPTLPSTPPAPVTTSAVLLAFGDIMVHSPQLPAYYDKTTNEYDFTPWFARVAPLLREGDWVVGNLETPLAGADLKYTGYPRFNAPASLADALAQTGVNIVSTANNHAMDRGFVGIERTLNNLSAAGIQPYGTASTAEEAEQLVIVTRNDIAMGFAAYTYGTNGIPLPKDKPYAVSMIDSQRMVEEIRRLREAGADAVTVSLHFGNEYERMPSDKQKRLARVAIGAGADIVLGSHPHVVQPYDIVDVPAEESALNEPRRGIVIYSLGNFISNQTGDWKDVGLIIGVHLTKTQFADGSSVTTWDRIDLSPTWVHIDQSGRYRKYTVLPLRQTLAALADASHTEEELALTAADYARMQTMLEEIDQHLHRLLP